MQHLIQLSPREIEYKYVVTGSLKQAHITVSDMFDLLVSKRQEGHSSDFFWRPPPTSLLHFIRLRRYASNEAELTVKAKDKGDNVNRLEVNLKIDNFDTALLTLELIHGSHIKELPKNYTTWYLPGNVQISLYEIVPDPRVFLEIEGPTEDSLKENEKPIIQRLSMQREFRSLFEIFIGDK